MDNSSLKVELGRDCVMVRPGYNGNRHRDSWVRHELPFGIVAWTYEDGELIEVSVPATARALATFTFEGWLPSSFVRFVRDTGFEARSRAALAAYESRSVPTDPER